MLKLGWKSTGDKDNLKSIAVSTLGAGITTGITTKLNIVKPTTFTDKLTKNAIDSATNTALQSTINGDSFKDTLKHQVVNSLVMTGAEYGANSIGTAYHNNSFSNNNFVNKATQLTLHAGLGAVSSKLTGGDYLSGAVAGVSAEVVAELYGNAKYGTTNGNLLTQDQKDVLKNIGGLAGGLSAIITAKSQGKDVKDIGNEAYAGQRVGQNAVENNLVAKVVRNLDNKLTELDIDNGKHSYIVVKPDKPEDFTDDKMKERGLDPNKFKFINLGNNEKGIIIGGYEINGNLEIGINQMTDYKTTIALDYNIDTPFNPEVRIIKSVNGMTDSQFIYSIMKNSNNYLNNQLNGLKVKYNIAPKVMPGYNCNSFSNSLLDYSDGDLNKNKDFNGIDWGINSKIPRYYFNNNK